MGILYYDCFSGISGDMNLAALIDLGVPASYLLDELKKLNLTGYEIKIGKASKQGIEGTRVEVILDSEKSITGKAKVNPSNLVMHQPQVQENTHKHAISTGQEHEHRTYGHIKSLILQSKLSDYVKELSIAIFEKVAIAEGKIHGKPKDEVHFHEVGAVDSIVDIVGAAICLEYLKPDKILSAPPQLGGGFVKCAHGTFPVPAPATAEILRGIPSKTGAVDAETTTPTGAAILATVVNEFTSQTNFAITKIGYGIGYKDFNIPNVLRVYFANDTNPAGETFEQSLLVECNIDDMSPERYEFVMERLFIAGADDVFLESIFMKKNRPAQKLSSLVSPSKLDKLLPIIFTETSTLGVRIVHCEKHMLHREMKEIATPWGPVRVKFGIYNNKTIKAKPEYDDCVRIARENNISISYVYDEINKLITL